MHSVWLRNICTTTKQSCSFVQTGKHLIEVAAPSVCEIATMPLHYLQHADMWIQNDLTEIVNVEVWVHFCPNTTAPIIQNLVQGLQFDRFKVSS